MSKLGRVLVVDDAAFARIAQAPPDLVLLDLRLPGIQGDAVFTDLRRTHPALPIVILSANADVERACELIKHGAFDYVPKPWDFDYLERVVSAATIGSSEVTGPQSS